VCYLVADAVCFAISPHGNPGDLYEHHFEYELFETEQAARRRFLQIKRSLDSR